jgi:hypothetical protein
MFCKQPDLLTAEQGQALLAPDDAFGWWRRSIESPLSLPLMTLAWHPFQGFHPHHPR